MRTEPPRFPWRDGFSLQINLQLDDGLFGGPEWKWDDDDINLESWTTFPCVVKPTWLSRYKKKTSQYIKMTHKQTNPTHIRSRSCVFKHSSLLEALESSCRWLLQNLMQGNVGLIISHASIFGYKLGWIRVVCVAQACVWFCDGHSFWGASWGENNHWLHRVLACFKLLSSLISKYTSQASWGNFTVRKSRSCETASD